MTDTISTAAPASAPASAPAPAAASALATPPGTEGQPGATPAAQPSGTQGNGTPGWVQPRIDELTHARRSAERERDMERAENQRLKALLGQPGAAPVSAPAAPATAPAPAPHSDDIDRRAQEIVAQREFDNRCNAVWNDAVTADPTFATAYQGMAKALGGVPDAFLRQLVTQPDAAKVLGHLTKDFDYAARLFASSPLEQGRELERLSAKISATPTPPTVSGAPPPTTQVDSGGNRTDSKDYATMPIDDFMRERNTSRRH